MHCNFLINLGNATAADIETLGETVRRRVQEHSGVELEWEIKRIGVPTVGRPGCGDLSTFPRIVDFIGAESESAEPADAQAEALGETMTKHVAVLMGGWSAEREVSLALGQGVRRCARPARIPRDADRCRARYRDRARRGKTRRRAQRAARTARRRRYPAGRPGNPRHSVQPFRRARLRARHAEGFRQGDLSRRRRSGCGRQGRVALRGGESAFVAAALCDQADRRRLERRRLHRYCRSTRTRRRSFTATIGRSATRS